MARGRRVTLGVRTLRRMSENPRVAVYWDFENVHASLLDELRGDGAYRRSFYAPQETIVDLEPVLDFAAAFGSIAINRAYGNWQWFGKYRGALQAQAVDLVQMFPLSGLKNGADIRLALDVLEDLHQYEHISHVVLVAGDSDYVALAQKCRKLGRAFIAVGMPKTNALFKAACDEFKYYGSLTEPVPSHESTLDPALMPAMEEAVPAFDMDHAAALILRALKQLRSGKDTPWVNKAGVRPMLVRLDSSWDESRYGFKNLSSLLSALDGLVAERTVDNHRDVAPRSMVESKPKEVVVSTAADPADAVSRPTEPQISPPPGADEPAAVDPVNPVNPIDRALRRLQVRLPDDRHSLWMSPALLLQIFESAPDRTLPSRQDVVAKLHGTLQALRPDASETDARKIQQIYFKVGSFDLLGRDVGIRLLITDEQELTERLARGLLERVRSQTPDLLEDEQVLIDGLCGDHCPQSAVETIQKVRLELT